MKKKNLLMMAGCALLAGNLSAQTSAAGGELVSLLPEGVKTEESDRMVTQNYVEDHVKIGIESLRMIIDEKKTVRHLKFDW